MLEIYYWGAWPFTITLIQGIKLGLGVSPLKENICGTRQHLTQFLMLTTHSPFRAHVLNPLR